MMKIFMYWLLLSVSSYSLTNYVDQASPQPTPPYTSWETAATTIEDAAGAALPSNTVLVADGHYTPSSTITVPEYGRLESVHGPEATYIEDAPEAVYISLSENARMSGFSVAGFEDDYAINGERYESCVISNCVVFGNNTGANDVTAYDCIISNNLGLGMSGNAYDCIIVDNENGGIEGGWESIISNCVIRGNIAYGNLPDDGAAGVSGAAYDCLIENNINFAGPGGGVGGYAENCIIRSNSATGNGGGMHAGSAVNCVFENNYAGGSGGGIHALEGPVTGCTFINNMAEQEGHALYGDDPGDWAPNLIVRNCIFAEEGNQPNTKMFGGRHSISYSSSINLRHGELGNLTNSPAFISFETGNYRLRPDSACVDAGINTGGTTTDLDGNPRVVSGSIDMGAYELQTAESAVMLPLRMVLEFSPDLHAWTNTGQTAEWLIPAEGSAAAYRARLEM